MDEKTVAAFVVITILAVFFNIAASIVYCIATRNKPCRNLLALAVFLHAMSVLFVIILSKMWDSCFK